MICRVFFFCVKTPTDILFTSHFGFVRQREGRINKQTNKKRKDAPCNCNLSALMVEVVRRPLTRRSSAHCARGTRGAAAPFGRGDVRGKRMDVVRGLRGLMRRGTAINENAHGSVGGGILTS